MLGATNKKLEVNENDWNDDKVNVITTDGALFQMHGSIVSEKSGKVAAALRFANMQETSVVGVTDPTRRVLHLGISSKHCAWMLQHIYHGSIATCLSGDQSEMCHELLELMIVAEEFLCFSLLQECEMRLLHYEPQVCFCWSCSRAVRCDGREENRVAECLYLAAGPSHLINGSTALDILGPIQHLEGMAVQYTIHQVFRPLRWLQCPGMVWAREDSNTTASTWSQHNALASLKRVTIATILSNFREVVQSEAFRESSDWNEREHDEVSPAHTTLHHRILLLQFCLEELATIVPPTGSQSFDDWSQLVYRS
jgi:hypothetical protein